MLKKEIKRTCTYRMTSSTMKMLDSLHETTGISRSEIIAQLVQSYYNTNSLKLKKEVSSKVYVAE